MGRLKKNETDQKGHRLHRRSLELVMDQDGRKMVKRDKAEKCGGMWQLRGLNGIGSINARANFCKGQVRPKGAEV